jgi:hypothetical protein
MKLKKWKPEYELKLLAARERLLLLDWEENGPSPKLCRELLESLFRRAELLGLYKIGAWKH